MGETMNSRVVAVISLYYPKEENAENAKKISQQVDYVYLCDNSKSNNENMFSTIENAAYCPNYQNLGLSKAFNKILKEHETEWNDNDYIIFFDQDSQIELNHINELIKEYEILSEKVNVGCIGPVFFNQANSTLEIPTIKTKIGNMSYSVNNTITSSMLMRYKILKELDYFNEELFLDLVDWDLCWRIRDKGYLCIITEKVVLNHCVGQGEKRIGIVKLRVGAPIREYYQTRDALYEIRRKYVPIKMRIRLIANVTIRPIVHLLFLDQRKERISYISNGYRDYRKKIHGEYIQ